VRSQTLVKEKDSARSRTPDDGFCGVSRKNKVDKGSRGPEIETWLGAEEGTDPATENDWGLLPFMALTDGAHAYVCPEIPPVPLYVPES
jgi:hypothetical protein